MKTDKVGFVLEKWNSFSKNIQFMYELDQESKSSILDVLLNRNGNNIEMTVYRKPTNSNIYLNRKSFAHDTWKRGTLRTLIKHAYLICSNKKYHEEELNHIKFDFENRNNFPKWVMFQLLNEARMNSLNNLPNTEKAGTNDMKSHRLVVPHTSRKDNKLIKSMQSNLKWLLPENVTTRSAYTGTKLSSKFTRTKDETLKEHQHDIVCYAECPENNCTENYTGETGRHLIELVNGRNGRDAKSHIFKHAVEKNHKPPLIEKFRVIGRRYNNITFKKKIAESLLIKEVRLSLNIHGKSVPLKLFN